MSRVCIWADGVDREPKDLAGIEKDIADALGAPRSAVTVRSSMGEGRGARYVVEIFAPEIVNYSRDGAS